jgi:Carboxypeptidase regulatory-like domain
MRSAMLRTPFVRRPQWIAALCFLTCFSWSSPAQTVSASIVGTVTDQGGAAVSEARVSATNLETGIGYTATTDEAGRYHLPGLSSGQYELRVESGNFETEVRKGITLTVAQVIDIKVVLKVGNASEEITVTASTPLVESVTSAVSGLVDTRQMSELPLNGRDLFQLVLLQAGVVPMRSAGPSPVAKGGLSRAAINGMRPTWNNLTLDGMDANDPFFNIPSGGTAGVFLGVEAIRELRSLTQTYEAEYGRNAGAMIEATTRSGTNSIHGSLFAFHRNAAFDAKNYFDLADRPIPPFTRNQFGGSFGGPLKPNRTFFFMAYEGLVERLGLTADATVPNALGHQGLLPSATPATCTAADTSGCVSIPVDARVRPFLDLVPLPNGQDFGNGTAQLVSSAKRSTNENYGLIRLDHALSNTHFIFGRYILDDSSSLVPYYSALIPGFPINQQARSQYFTLQDQKSIGPRLLNELRFGINRTTYLASIRDTHPGLSISLLPNRPLGALEIAGEDIIGNNTILPIGGFSTTPQVQEQLWWTKGRHALKLGGEFRRIDSNGPADFLINGLYSFQDLSFLGPGFVPVSDNPALEFFLKAQPLLYAGTDPALSDSDRHYRQTAVFAFAQDDLRVSSSLILNVGLRYEYYANPTEARGRISNIRNPASDTMPTVGKFFARTPADLFSPRLGFAWNFFGNGNTVLRGGFGMFRDQISTQVYSFSRFLPPFFKTVLAVLPDFLDPLNALKLGSAPGITTYYPKFPYALQYNLNLQRQLTADSVIKAGYLGARGNHLQRLGEVNPFEPALGRRINPNFSSLPFVATDAQSFYNSLQLAFEQRYNQGFSMQAAYTFSHSIDDASVPFPTDAVNEPAKVQDLFNRKGSRGRSSFDVRHILVFNFDYELPFGRGKQLGAGLPSWASSVASDWQFSGIGSFQSNAPFTPVLGFDNAATGSLLLSDRPNLVGDPYSGNCPDGMRTGVVTCWFNPGAFALPPPGQYGHAGRNSLRGPDFGDIDLALLRRFTLGGERNLEFRAETFNLINHPNFSVPLNTRGPIILGGNGDAVFVGRDPQDPAKGIVPGNAGRIFSTTNSSRQIQLGVRFIF